MIRRTMFVKMLIAMVVVMGCLAATAHAAADPNGTWKWKRPGQNGQEFEMAVTLKGEGEKLTGTIALPMGDTVEIKDGTFKNDEVNFTVNFEFNGNSITVKYKGKVEGDTIKGKTERERDGQVMSRDWEAKREKK
jgi:hypothetical protein